MEVEVTETKTYLEISEVAGSQVAPSEIKQVISPESETEVTVEVQEQAPNVLQVTENKTTVEVIQQNISIIDIEDDHPHYLLMDGSRQADEIRLKPKESSNGPEGTIFYASADDHVWVATE
jgi:hypothetical protein